MVSHQVSPGISHLADDREVFRASYHEIVNLLASFRAFAPSPVVLSHALSPVASTLVVPPHALSPCLAELFLVLSVVVLPPESARIFFH